MKLPGINYTTAVGPDVSALPLQTARAWSGAISSIGGAVKDFVDAKDEESSRQQLMDDRMESVDTLTLLEKPRLTPNEIPSNVEYKRTEKKLVNGVMTEVPREFIPTHEVQQQIYDNLRAEQKARAKENLSSGAFRKYEPAHDEYTIAGRIKNSMSQLKRAQEDEADKLDARVRGLESRGLWDDARVSVANNPFLSEGDIALKLAEIDIKQAREEEKAAIEAELAPVQNAAMHNDVATLQMEKARLMDENYAGVLDIEVRRRTVDYIDRELDRAQAEIEAVQAKANERFYSDANMAVDNGQAGPLQIEQWYADRLIKPNQRTALHRRYDVVTRAETQKADYSTMASEFVNGERYASPANPDHKKAVNQYAEGGAEQALDITVKTGILPDNMRDAFTSSAVNATDEEAAELLPVYTAIEDAKPQVFSKLNKDTKDVYTLAAALYRSGFEPERAMESARKGLNMPDAERKFYEDRYTTEIKESDNVSALRNYMEGDETFEGSLFRLEADMDYAIAQLQFEYETAVKTFYIQSGGNLSLAQKAAYNEVKRSYGVTAVGGGFELTTTGEFEEDWEEQLRRPMKYPAEKMTGLPTSQVQELFRSYAVDRGYGAENLYYIDDDETARSADNPSYQVIYHDRDTGDFYPLRRPDNTIDRWKPLDWIQPTIERKREAALAPARERRQDIIENREANVQARETADMFDERIMTSPQERQQMQREFFGND